MFTMPVPSKRACGIRNTNLVSGFAAAHFVHGDALS
jgi:hypothetical protein